MKAYIDNYEININENKLPYKGKRIIINSFGQSQYVDAYFFNESNTQLAYYIYRDPITNLVIVKRDSNEIDDFFASRHIMQDVPEDEIRTQYCQMLLDYIHQQNMEDVFQELNKSSIYIEDKIVESLNETQQLGRKK